jgi:hypothetical protein
MRGLTHQWVHHEVWRVGFDYMCCLGFADDMALVFNGLVKIDSGDREKEGGGTMSHPNRAEAIAEK